MDRVGKGEKLIHFFARCFTLQNIPSYPVLQTQPKVGESFSNFRKILSETVVTSTSILIGRFPLYSYISDNSKPWILPHFQS